MFSRYFLGAYSWVLQSRVTRSFEATGHKKGKKTNLGLVFVVLTMISIGCDNILLTKAIAVMWDCYNKVWQGKKHKCSDHQTGCEHLLRLSKPLHLRWNQKWVHPKCPNNPSLHVVCVDSIYSSRSKLKLVYKLWLMFTTDILGDKCKVGCLSDCSSSLPCCLVAFVNWQIIVQWYYWLKWTPQLRNNTQILINLNYSFEEIKTGISYTNRQRIG